MTREPMAMALICALLSMAASSTAAETPLGIRASEPAIEVTSGETQLLTYRYGGVPFKPYAAAFCSPRGVNILRDAPHDHLHHHALMFAVAIDGVDFWAETLDGKPGYQRHREIRAELGELAGGRSSAVIVQQLAWMAPGTPETALADERRTIMVSRSPQGDASLLTWQTTLSPAAGRASLTLGGSHYFGLGLRFLESMDRDGQLLYATGEPGPIVRGQERLTPARWVAYVAAAEGRPVTVGLFDHPENPRHPAAMFTMPAPFAYLSATLDLARQPLQVESGKPLSLRYGVALWDGRIEPAAIEQMYETWLQSERKK